MKGKLGIILIEVFVLLFASCSKESGNADKNTGSGIITENSTNKIETQGSILSIGNNLVGTWSSSEYGNVIFKNDGKVEITYFELIIDYVLKDGVITYTQNGDHIWASEYNGDFVEFFGGVFVKK